MPCLTSHVHRWEESFVGALFDQQYNMCIMWSSTRTAMRVPSRVVVAGALFSADPRTARSFGVSCFWVSDSRPPHPAVPCVPDTFVSCRRWPGRGRHRLHDDSWLCSKPTRACFKVGDASSETVTRTRAPLDQLDQFVHVFCHFSGQFGSVGLELLGCFFGLEVLGLIDGQSTRLDVDWFRS